MLNKNQQLIISNLISQRNNHKIKSNSPERNLEDQKKSPLRNSNKSKGKTLYEAQYEFLSRQQKLNQDKQKRSLSKENSNIQSSINQSALTEYLESQDSFQYPDNYKEADQMLNERKKSINKNQHEGMNTSQQNASSQKEFEAQLIKKLATQNKSPLKIRQCSFSNLHSVNQAKATFENKIKQNYQQRKEQQNMINSQRAMIFNQNQEDETKLSNSNLQQQDQDIQLTQNDKGISQKFSDSKGKIIKVYDKHQSNSKNSSFQEKDLEQIIKNHLVNQKKQMQQQQIPPSNIKKHENKSLSRENKKNIDKNAEKIYVVEDLPNYKQIYGKLNIQKKKPIQSTDKISIDFFRNCRQETPKHIKENQNPKFKRNTQDKAQQEQDKGLEDNSLNQIEDISWNQFLTQH